jgi:pyruvate/2-oxoglutarate dehydrogenase complex dihydrolipoamide acyltransferase (E2) component
MVEIKAAEALWASAMAPEGLVERWFVPNAAAVAAGQAVVEVRIEDALHMLEAPAAGRLTILAAVNDLIEPGSVLARVER